MAAASWAGEIFAGSSEDEGAGLWASLGEDGRLRGAGDCGAWGRQTTTDAFGCSDSGAGEFFVSATSGAGGAARFAGTLGVAVSLDAEVSGLEDGVDDGGPLGSGSVGAFEAPPQG